MPPLLTFVARLSDGLPLVANTAPDFNQGVTQEHKNQAKDILRGLGGTSRCVVSFNVGHLLWFGECIMYSIFTSHCLLCHFCAIDQFINQNVNRHDQQPNLPLPRSRFIMLSHTYGTIVSKTPGLFISGGNCRRLPRIARERLRRPGMEGCNFHHGASLCIYQIRLSNTKKTKGLRRPDIAAEYDKAE